MREKLAEYGHELPRVLCSSVDDTIRMTADFVRKFTRFNDYDLEAFDELVKKYYASQIILPAPELAQISHLASHYIAQEIQVPLKESESSDVGIVRKIWLMQKDIFTLHNDRYIKPYIKTIKTYLEEYLRVNPGEFHDFDMLFQSHETGIGKTNTSLLMRVYSDLLPLSELFTEPKHHRLQKECIVPFLTECLIGMQQFTEQDQGNISQAMKEFQDRVDGYNILRPSVRAKYEELCQRIDKKYGVFYRKQIYLCMNSSAFSSDTNQAFLKKNPEIALFCCIQGIFLGTLSRLSHEKMDEMLRHYFTPGALSADYTLLLGSILLEFHPECLIRLFMNCPGMLNIPEAMYLVTESLRLIPDTGGREKMIQELDDITKQHGGHDFLDHIQYMGGVYVSSEDISLEDKEYIFLALGNCVILENRDRKDAIEFFNQALKIHTSAESLFQISSLHRENPELAIKGGDNLVDHSKEVFLLTGTKESLKDFLWDIISQGNFEEAEKYIQYGLREGYDILDLVITFYLKQNKKEHAFIGMIELMQQEGMILHDPEGFVKLLFQAIEEVMESRSQEMETKVLKVYASYILANVRDNQGCIQNIRGYVNHWECIDKMMHSSGEHQNQSLLSSLRNITGITLDDPDSLYLPDYLLAHAKTIYGILQKEISRVQESIENLQVSQQEYEEWEKEIGAQEDYASEGENVWEYVKHALEDFQQEMTSCDRYMKALEKQRQKLFTSVDTTFQMFPENEGKRYQKSWKRFQGLPMPTQESCSFIIPGKQLVNGIFIPLKKFH